MITITLKGEKVTVKPSALHVYLERIEYIKSRRMSPIDALKNLPPGITEANYAKFVEIAISSSMKLSSVSFDEEMAFEASQEGFYLTVFQALKEHMTRKDSAEKWPTDPIKGVSSASFYYETLSDEEKTTLRLAMRGVDERALAKNSDSPTPPEPGPESKPSEQSLGI